MRVDSNYYSQILNSLNTTETKLQTDLQELSTSRRVNKPSDDPTASALEVNNLAATSDAAAYQQNITSAQTFLNTASSALSSVVTALNQAVTLGVEGAGGTATASQNAQTASTVSGIRDQILSLANTSVQGVYVFAGTASGTQPFALNSTSTTGVTYSGNSNVNQVQIGNGNSVAGNISGDSIFLNSSGNVMQGLNDLVTALNANNQTGIETATTEIKSALDVVSQQKSAYSSTLTQMTSESTYLQSETVTLQTQQNNLVGADLATVITDLTQTQVSVQATMQATAKILPMSLMNYLQ